MNETMRTALVILTACVNAALAVFAIRDWFFWRRERRLAKAARIRLEEDLRESFATLDALGVARPPCPWHPPPDQLRDLDCDFCGGLKSDGRPLVYVAPGFKRPVLYIVGTDGPGRVRH